LPCGGMKPNDNVLPEIFVTTVTTSDIFVATSLPVSLKGPATFALFSTGVATFFFRDLFAICETSLWCQMIGLAVSLEGFGHVLLEHQSRFLDQRVLHSSLSRLLYRLIVINERLETLLRKSLIQIATRFAKEVIANICLLDRL